MLEEDLAVMKGRVNLVIGDPKQIHCTLARSSPQGCGESARWYSSRLTEEEQKDLNEIVRSEVSPYIKKKSWWKFWEWFL